MKSKKLALFLLAGVLAMSTSALLTKVLQNNGYSSLQIATGRLQLAIIILLPIINLQQILTIPRRILGTCCLGGIFLGLHFFAWMESLKHISVAESTALVTTSPIWILIGSFFFSLARIRISYIGIFLSTLGTTLLIYKGIANQPYQNNLAGYILAILGAIFMGAYLLLGEKLKDSISLGGFIFATSASSCLFLTTLLIIFSGQTIGFYWTNFNSLVLFVFIAIVPQLFGHTLVMLVSRKVSSVLASLAIVCEPIFAAILAYFLLSETIDILTFIAFTFLVFGLFIATLDLKNMSEPERNPK